MIFNLYIILFIIMDYFNLINYDNGDILLEKKYLDTQKYDIINENNGNILLKLKKDIIIKNTKDLKKYDFTKSTILECKLNNEKINYLKYKHILENIYNKINDGSNIIKKTKLNIKTIKKTTDGFTYLKNIGISVQTVNSNQAINEILNQCIENNINIFIKIELNKNNNKNINNIIKIQI